MNGLKRVREILFSRQALVIVAVVVLAVATWFIGPLLAFDDRHPFGGIAVRIVAIAMLLAFALCWIVGRFVGELGVAAVCLLVWQLGPLVGIDGKTPLAPAWARVAAIAAIAAVYAGYRLNRFWQGLRTDEAKLKQVLRVPPDAAKTDADAQSRAALRALDSVVSKAVAQLKRLRRGAPGFSRIVDGSRHLYELPWFVLIGAPGSGKTTAVLNAGLEFPIAEQMHAPSEGSRTRTVNCDWWFTNAAVLIDTAGRYTEQRVTSDEPAAAANAGEWRGLLGLLRKHRPLAPVNGAVLAISVADLVNRSPAERTALAATLRARLGELGHDLGIRFPVYVLVTKLDLLPGFVEYFQSLTADARAQVWGFTLPYRDDRRAAPTVDLRRAFADELSLLIRRIDAGSNNRLLEEFDGDRRKTLYALPLEFRSLSEPLVELLGLVFADSRYDDTQLQNMLRGVYFSSALQSGDVVAADRGTLMQRLHRKLARRRAGEDATPSASVSASAGAEPAGHRSYFLRNLFEQIVARDAHLVRPNRRWALRSRLLRAGGHLLALAVFAWLAVALYVSDGNNRTYLGFVETKTGALDTLVNTYRRAQHPAALNGMLVASRDLPQMTGLDLDAPGWRYRYGLYVAPGVADAADTTYANLLREALLPQVARRIEQALDERMATQDADGVYRALTVYLMLYDDAHDDAKAIKAWVLRDWDRSDSPIAAGNRAEMAEHLDALFVDGRPVKPSGSQNAELTRRARAFLNANSAPKRLYERAMSAMEADAPENFTLARAVGGRGMTVFAMAPESRLDQGVPGLYTYDGYHEVFNRRLPEFVVQAQKDDAWVMGRQAAPTQWTDALRTTRDAMLQSTLADDVRRQYLTDYAAYWQQFLADVRPVAALDGGTSGTLALELDALRTLASPDSPLTRLARAAVHQTSLSAVEPGGDGPDAAAADGALAVAGRRSNAVRAAADAAKKIADRRPERKLEKALVDNRFAALREVVTGQADTGSGPAIERPATGGSALRLGAIVDLINEQYTRLVVADNALAANAMPPAADIGTRLQTEAAKLPAPLQAVLSGVATQTSQKVGQEMGALLAKQADSSVGDACRRSIDGKYPFANSAQEVDIEDFNRMFAAGGLLDDFFQKSLAPYVDANAKPWRYKSPSPGMPPIRGPALEPFERAAAIRDVMFREPGAKRMAWKLSAKVAALDPEITDLSIDIDGQTMRYAHGPVTPLPVTWPGPRSGAIATLTANPRLRRDTATIQTTGPWALFHLIERGRLVETASASRLLVRFAFDDRQASLELTTPAGTNPLTSNLLAGFHCPGGA